MIEILNVQDKNGYELMNGRYDVLAKLPDSCTNGEVLMAMLNPYKICEYKYSVHVYMTEKDFLNGNYQMNLDSDWWYAPYKKEVEE